MPDATFIDVRTSELTLSELIEEIGRLQMEHPDMEILMDGDLYAVVGRRRDQRREVIA